MVLFVALLLAAAAAFVIGVAVERDQGHGDSGNSHSSVTPEGVEGTHSEAGEEGRESTENGETNGTAEQDSGGVGDESMLGIDPESSAAVATAVLISLVLAGVVWRWPVLPTLVAGAVFCLGAAAFDMREVAHQIAEGRHAVAFLALLVAALHLAAAGSATAASAQRWRGNEVMAVSGSGGRAAT